MEINTVTISLKKYHNLLKCQEAFKNTGILKRTESNYYKNGMYINTESDYLAVEVSEPLQKALDDVAFIDNQKNGMMEDVKDLMEANSKLKNKVLDLESKLANKKKWYQF